MDFHDIHGDDTFSQDHYTGGMGEIPQLIKVTVEVVPVVVRAAGKARRSGSNSSIIGVKKVA